MRGICSSIVLYVFMLSKTALHACIYTQTHGTRFLTASPQVQQGEGEEFQGFGGDSNERDGEGGQRSPVQAQIRPCGQG